MSDELNELRRLALVARDVEDVEDVFSETMERELSGGEDSPAYLAAADVHDALVAIRRVLQSIAQAVTVEDAAVYVRLSGVLDVVDADDLDLFDSNPG